MAEATGLRYAIRVADGGLALGVTMSLIPRMASTETLVEMLIKELNERKIVFGLDHVAILQLMRERTLNAEVMVAHGIPMRRGTNAEIELLRVPPSFMSMAGADGRVDYKNVENVSPVKAGDVISRKTPADPGEPGMNVFGKQIPAPPVSDAQHPGGKNTVISPDGLEMSAAIDGFLRWNGDRIDVVELYVVIGDVDLHTGNVRYHGDVEIYGNVQPGFEVLAGGNVEVYGSVDGGRVVSERGTVLVTQGVMGSSEGMGSVEAEGDVTIGRARFARLQSRNGSITAAYAVEHSEIRAAGDLVLQSGPAMSCVVEVAGKVDVMDVTTTRNGSAAPIPWTPAQGNRRRHLRVLMSPPAAAQINVGADLPAFDAKVMDLSAGGARIRLAQRLQEDARFQMQFKIDGVEGTMWMEAEVVRTCLPASGKADLANSYGVQFVQIEPAVHEAIAKFCLAEDLKQHRLTGRAADGD